MFTFQPNAPGGGQTAPPPGPAPAFGSPTHIPHAGPLTPGTSHTSPSHQVRHTHPPHTRYVTHMPPQKQKYLTPYY